MSSDDVIFHKTLPLRGPLRDPLRGRFSSRRLSLNFSPIHLNVCVNGSVIGHCCTDLAIGHLTLPGPLSMQSLEARPPEDLGACLTTGETGPLRQETIVSQNLFCDPVAVFAWFEAHNHGLKGPRSPKHIATIAVCDPISHLLSLLLGRDPCGDRILRSCLQKGPATTPANYGHQKILAFVCRRPW